jgi:hypothetical protein
MPDNPSQPKKSIGAELIIPVAALVFTLYYFSTIIDSPWTAQVAAAFIGTILIALVLAFIGRTVLMVMRGEADLGMKNIIEPLTFLPIRMGLIGLTILYTIAIQWGGFTLTSFVFMALATLMLNRGRSKGRAVMVAICFSISGYLLFIVAFGIRFPKGPFENLMQAVF